MVIKESDNEDIFESANNTIISNIKTLLGKGLGWIFDSVVDDIFNISNHKPLNGSSYIKLPKELDHSKKGLINIIDIDDNECFKWRLGIYLHPADYHPARIRKVDKYFAREFDLKDMKFPVKIRYLQN